MRFFILWFQAVSLRTHQDSFLCAFLRCIQYAVGYEKVGERSKIFRKS